MLLKPAGEVTADDADEKCPKLAPNGTPAELLLAGEYNDGCPSGPLLALPESVLNNGPLCWDGGGTSEG